MLDATPAPHGAERPAARALVEWGRQAHASLVWEVDTFGREGANVVVTLPGDVAGPPALLLYSHLDTSLSGFPHEDAPITGRNDAPAPLRLADGEVSGPGLGVARGPVASALIGLTQAADRLAGRPHRTIQVLLAGSGTHRSTLSSALPSGAVDPAPGAGVFHHLTARPRPDAVVVAKCGPPAVLLAEPGACYLAVSVRGRWGTALAPGSATPTGGMVSHAGLVLDTVVRWRAGFIAERSGRADGVGGEVGIGALTAGRPDKPDLLPALLDLRLYAVTVPGDDAAGLVASLQDAVRADLAGGPLADCDVGVRAEPVHDAAGTPPTAAVAVAATRAWGRHLGGAPDQVRNWTGSTDGVVFRGAGIDTARLGPVSRPDPEDARRDRLALADLAAFAEIYADVAVQLAGEPAGD